MFEFLARSNTFFFEKKTLPMNIEFFFLFLVSLFVPHGIINWSQFVMPKYKSNRIESNLKWYDMNVSFNGRIQFILLDLAQEMCRACYTYRYKLLFIEIMCQFHCIHLFIYSYIYIIHSQFLRLLKWFFIFHIYFLFFLLYIIIIHR